ncbi:MAG: hypothetical protein L0Z50_02255 [Verrucomicrobiales bacterium]|nr:hypothetical protein [Verrucomicrobiales bacterium]
MSKHSYETQGEVLSKMMIAADGSLYVRTFVSDVSATFNFVRKFTPNGEFIWEVSQISFGVTFSLLDKEGNLYWAQMGQTHGSAQLGPPLTYLLSIWKYDSEGNLVWSRSGEAEDQEGYDSGIIGIDGAGKITATFAGTKFFTVLHFEQNTVPGWPVLVSIPSVPNYIQTWAGQPVTVKMEARGAPPLHFQWRFNEAYILGATNADLIIANAQPNNSGNYSVLVTNHVGCTISPPIYRKVVGVEPFQFDQPAIVTEIAPGANGSVVTNTFLDVIFRPSANVTYKIEASTNLLDWAGNQFISSITGAPVPLRFWVEDRRFFRAVVLW